MCSLWKMVWMCTVHISTFKTSITSLLSYMFNMLLSGSIFANHGFRQPFILLRLGKCSNRYSLTHYYNLQAEGRSDLRQHLHTFQNNDNEERTWFECNFYFSKVTAYILLRHCKYSTLLLSAAIYTQKVVVTSKLTTGNTCVGGCSWILFCFKMCVSYCQFAKKDISYCIAGIFSCSCQLLLRVDLEYRYGRKCWHTF